VIGAGRAKRARDDRPGEAIHGPGKGLHCFVAPANTLARFARSRTLQKASEAGLLLALTS
jgi:hypothetical protein